MFFLGWVEIFSIKIPRKTVYQLFYNFFILFYDFIMIDNKYVSPDNVVYLPVVEE